MSPNTKGIGQNREDASYAECQRKGKAKTPATAESMAAKQRDISVSEFFAKNRHLLGFDNPRKALLTTVKEAVDNSLDACEEAGIVPEIGSTSKPPARTGSKSASGQRARHRQEADPADLRQAALRLEVSPAPTEPRATGHRHQRGWHVRHANDRQAGEDHLEVVAKKPAHYYEIQIDTKRNDAGNHQRQRRGSRHSGRRKRGQVHRRARHRMGVTRCPSSDSESHFNRSKRIIEMGGGTNRRELFNLAQARSYMQTLLVGIRMPSS